MATAECAGDIANSQGEFSGASTSEEKILSNSWGLPQGRPWFHGTP